ncbi:multidrug resistance protein MdtO [Ancylobacter sp. 3268]|uniref:FUSC family protein n=1 Tax=Ancylobacter sp. 3268 TaxID=2817752 RepID=UPI002859F519|nr:FUSC family protein [Ancylobacter sp. 3268]MDR6955726.1 multidrug resistance protein MdtO [Ancylobacter sp. 3268]
MAMAGASEAPDRPLPVPRSLLSQAITDLAPFPGRAALTWRIALLCALVSATAMLFQTPEAAISCYLVIFLMKPDAVQNIGTAIGLIVLVALVVLALVPIINATVEVPLLRLLAIALVSFVFLFIGAASQLGEIGGVIGLVFAFLLTLVNMAPVADVVTFGLRYAAYMAMMPMAWMIAFNLVLGLSPVRLLRATLRERLEACADAIGSGAPARHEALVELLRADNTALEKQAGFVRLLNLVRRENAAQITRDVRASYRLMMATSGLPDDLDPARRTGILAALHTAIAALDAGERPPMPPAPDIAAGAAESEIVAALAIIAGAPEGEVVAAPKAPFFFPDAFSNPAYQRFALKTTAAAVICYLIYTGLDWSGIHTAMITCYVAALGTTGETVHKLGLRILGCLIGAAMGMAAILFVMPQLETVGGLMVLVFAGVLVGAWISTGPERIAYGGVQVALAFLLTVLQGFGPATSLDTAWDRVVGILLGNVVIYLIFTRLWPVPIESAVRAHLRAALAGVKRIAALAPELRPHAVQDAALVGSEIGKAAELTALIPFEPAAIRAAPLVEAVLRETTAEIGQLVRDVYLARVPAASVETSLTRLDAAVTT